MQLIFAPGEGEEAGLIIYMNNKHHYEIALTKLDGEQCLILRRQIGTLKAVEAKVPYAGTEAENDAHVTKFTYKALK